MTLLPTQRTLLRSGGAFLPDFNICVVQPEGYIHSAAFAELAELICYGLQDLGHSVSIKANKTFAEATNIIIGCHFLDPGWIDSAPKRCIVINTEQIFADQVAWNSRIFAWASNFETWDFSERNIIKLKEVGVKNPKWLRLGFHRKLARIQKPQVQDIDVLFYGSVNERRRKIIKELEASGCNVKVLLGVYGQERDKLIARSKVVLNLHYYESQIFEIVRVSYLMINSKAVVGEVGDNTWIDSAYLDGFSPSSYDALVQACMSLVANDHIRKELEAKALARIKKLPQHKLMAPLIN